LRAKRHDSFTKLAESATLSNESADLWLSCKLANLDGKIVQFRIEIVRYRARIVQCRTRIVLFRAVS
jgi:hypothetical protein